MDLREIYTQMIAEQSRSHEHRYHLENPDIVKDGVNPSCGDEIQLEIKIDNGILTGMSFTGDGCAISQASTSMMIGLLKGQTIREALRLVKLFISMIQGETTDDSVLEELDEAISLKNVSTMPARVKCAVLAWRTLEKTVDEYECNVI